jgi:hypothetical protein
MQSRDPMSDAVRVAREVIAGHLEPSASCSAIAEIGKKLQRPPEPDVFVFLDHEQIGHEYIGVAYESVRVDIFAACRGLRDWNTDGHVV